MPTIAPPAAKPSSSAQTLKALRTIHLYFGVFIAPMLLFFAFTGAVQTLGLHEAAADYQAPNLLISLGQIHKKQTYLLPESHKPAPPKDHATSPANAIPATATRAPDSPAPNSRSREEPSLAAKQKKHLPLKLYFVLVSFGLFVSTGTGIYMAYKYNRKPLVITALLLAGTLLPIILVGF